MFLHSQILVILEKHLLGDEDVAETVKMSGDKFIFTEKLFSDMKEALQIVEQKDSGHLGLLKMEFDGEDLKITIRYYNPKKTKLIYIFKTHKKVRK